MTESSVRTTGIAPLHVKWQPHWRWLLLAACVGGAAGLWLMLGMPGLAWLSGASSRPEQPTPSDDGSAAKTSVTLSPAKLAEAKIETKVVAQESIRSDATVPGRVTYDTTRRLAVTVPVDCTVIDVLVQPGQSVAAGDRLVVLASPEVGMARDQVARARDDRHIAEHEFENAREIFKNAKSLVAFLEQLPAPAAALKEFTGKKLGEHREHVLSSYSKLVVAKAAVDETNSLGPSGALSRRVIQQRQSDFEVATAGFESQKETTLFECLQAQHKATAALAQEDRLLRVAQARLKRLLGSLMVEDERPLKDDLPLKDDEPAAEGETDADKTADLSQLIVVASQGGKIEDHVVIKHQRLKGGDEIVTVADTSVLWISANIHEYEWHATSLRPGDTVQVHFPALGEERFPAKVRFVGSQISEETRSVPLVAEIPNRDGLLKPGMYAWVSLPMEQSREAIVVPASAVMRHENQAFVFVDEGQGKFRRVDVQPGLELPERIEIVTGLRGGERIVTSGAFVLKSELLLEHEEE